MMSDSKLPSVRLMVMLLCALGVALSCVALYEHVIYSTGLATGPSFCNVSRHVNCEAVNASVWSTFLGVPIASYGIFFYTAIFILMSLSGFERLVDSRSATAVAWLGSVSAVVLSVVLFAISEFIIGALCLICLGLYLINSLLLLVLWRVVTRGAAVRTLTAATEILLNFAKTVFSVGNEAKRARIAAVTMIALASLCVYLPRGLYAVLAMTKSQGADNATAPSTEGTPVSVDPLELWRREGSVSISSDLASGAFRDYDEGDPSAPVQIVEFADFECPGCRHFYVSLRNLLKQYEGRYHLIFRNYPLDQRCNPRITREFHRNACIAAYFTRCAGEQGKFWEALDLVFTDPILEDRNASGEGVREFLLTKGVESLSLDGDAIRVCLESDRYRAKMQADVKEADRIGLSSTPSLWINGKKVEHPTVDVVAKIIEAVTRAK